MQSAVDSIVFPLSTSQNIISSTSFYGALRLLDTTHNVKINQFPYVLVKNNKKFVFESVQNIPYLVKNTTTDSTTVQDNNSYEYRDVGLKINGVAQIYDDFVSLDLDLTIEDIVNTSIDTLTPSTNKRYLNSITNLKSDEVLLLSGIKQNKKDKSNIRVPILCNIPYIGKMFQYKYTTDSQSNITIAIQVISSGFQSADANLPLSEERTSGKER